MRQELDEALVKDFPLLYADRGGSMQKTCMYWGFSCGDGWEPIIRDLSSKLEPIIADLKEKNEIGDCANCGCGFLDHKQYPGGRICKKIHHLPYYFGHAYGYFIPQWKRDMLNAWKGKGWWYGKEKPSRIARLWWMFKRVFKQDINSTYKKWKGKLLIKPANKLSRWAFDKFGFGYKKACQCNDHVPVYPKAAQVKEKFGTLSFYMTTGTDEIYDLIAEAEKKSAVTCEVCGEPGELRRGGWLKTLCDKHAEERHT